MKARSQPRVMKRSLRNSKRGKGLKNRNKKARMYDRERRKSLVNIGEAFQRCRNLRHFKGKTDKGSRCYGQASNNVTFAVSMFSVFNRSIRGVYFFGC